MCLASMAVIASAMDLAERPRAAQPQVTTVKPEVTTEDTTNRILSLPNEEKCAKRKFVLQCSKYIQGDPNQSF